jgi:hypothetical protein
MVHNAPVTVRGDCSTSARSALLSEPLRDTSLTDFARLFTLPELCRTNSSNRRQYIDVPEGVCERFEVG